MPLVHGSALKNTVDGCGVFQRRVRQMLEEKGINEINIDNWYDLETVQGVINDLASSVGGNLLLEIGKHVPKNSVFPPEIDSFEKAVMALDIAYQMNHQKGYVGEYKITKDNNTIKVVCNTPAYPAKFNLGLLKGLARKFNSFAKIDEVHSNGGGEFTVTL